jgi:hypothetical protein
MGVKAGPESQNVPGMGVKLVQKVKKSRGRVKAGPKSQDVLIGVSKGWSEKSGRFYGRE